MKRKKIIIAITSGMILMLVSILGMVGFSQQDNNIEKASYSAKVSNYFSSSMDATYDISKDGDNSVTATYKNGTLTIRGEGVMKNWNDYSSKPWTSSEVREVVIEKGVKNIGSYLFNGCTEIQTVTIPNSVISIGTGVFQGCDRLTDITIPDSVKSIGSDAFRECRELRNITIPSSVTTIGGWTFVGCTNLQEVKILGRIEEIPDYMFQGCERLKSVTIQNGVQRIGMNAFDGCQSLANITLPNSVTNIGYKAFSECGLTNIEIPSKVTSIVDSTFNGCSNLRNVTIPSSVTSIGENAFSNCNSDLTIKCELGSYAQTYANVKGLKVEIATYKSILLDHQGGSGEVAMIYVKNNTSTDMRVFLYNRGIYSAYNSSEVIPNIIPIRSGYEFKGYYVKNGNNEYPVISEYGNLIEGDGISYLLTASNISIYAKWEEHNITSIILDDGTGRTIGYLGQEANGSNGKIYYFNDSHIYIPYNVGEVIPNIIPGRTGSDKNYIFKGYYTSANDGTMIIDEAGRLTSMGSYTIARNTISKLYAQWEEHNITSIILDDGTGQTIGYLGQEANGSNGTIYYFNDSHNYIPYQVGEVIPHIIPERTGSDKNYVFKGYYTSASDGTMIIDEAGKLTSMGSYTIARNTISKLYAQWEEHTITSITLDDGTGQTIGYLGQEANGGNGKIYYFNDSHIYIPYNVGEVIPNIIPERTGSDKNYVFKGYYTSANDGTMIIDEAGKLTSMGSYTIARNTISKLYAQWEEHTITSITLDDGTGQTIGYLGQEANGSNGKIYYFNDSHIYIPYNVGEVIPNIIPERTEAGNIYVFKGYYTGANDGTMIIDEAGKLTSMGSYTIARNTISKLYAQWEEVSINSIALDDGTGKVIDYLYQQKPDGTNSKIYQYDSVKHRYIAYNAGEPIADIIPTRTETEKKYVFKGYFTDANEGTVIIDEEGKLTTIGSYLLSRSIVPKLYAQWEESGITETWDIGTNGDSNIKAELTDSGALIISGTGAMQEWRITGAPWYSKKEQIKKVIIENGITNIGNHAFDGCSDLTSIVIPNSVTSIGDYAFSDCRSLTSITLPNGLTCIGNSAFARCTGLISVTIPEGVTSIGEMAFVDCSNLISVTIPKSVTSIGEGAFRGCNENLVIRCYKDSIAENYAKVNNINYEWIDSEDPNDPEKPPLTSYKTITLDANGGANNVSIYSSYFTNSSGKIFISTRGSYPSEVSSLPIPVREGYKFKGYYNDGNLITNENGEIQKLSSDAISKLNNNPKLTAEWEKIDNPGGDNPGGDNPGGDNPGGDNPGGDNPGGDNPGGDNPGGDNPGGDNPGGDNPGGDNPGGDNPGGDNPGGDNPGGNNPGGNNSGGNGNSSGSGNNAGNGFSTNGGNSSTNKGTTSGSKNATFSNSNTLPKTGYQVVQVILAVGIILSIGMSILFYRKFKEY